MTTSRTEPELLDEHTVTSFERDGFVVVPGLLTDDELHRYGAAVTAAVADRTRSDSTPLAEKSRYQQSFVQCINLWEDHPEVAPLVFHPRVGQAAAELLRVPTVRLWHDQALTKRAGGRVTDAHQDHPYWPIAETASVTAWIPFDGSTAAGGAMSYLPGSHAIGLRKFVNIFFGEPEDILTDPEVAGIEPVLVEVPKGSVAFHHGLTVHLAGANVTDRDRMVQTIIYFPEGSTRGYPFPHFAVDRGGVEVGDVIDSDVTPIAWPRPVRSPVPALPAVPFGAAPPCRHDRDHAGAPRLTSEHPRHGSTVPRVDRPSSRSTLPRSGPAAWARRKSGAAHERVRRRGGPTGPTTSGVRRDHARRPQTCPDGHRGRRHPRRARDPRGDGLHQDRRDAGHHRPVHNPDPARRVRRAGLVAPSGRRRRLGNRCDSRGGPRRYGPDRLAGVRRAGRHARDHHRRHPDPGPPDPVGFSRGLLVAQRPDRIPHRRRDPGGDGTARGNARRHIAERRHDPQVRRHTPRDPRHEHGHARRLRRACSP